MGLFFAMEGVQHLAKGWLGDGDGLVSKINDSLADHDVLPPYDWFLQNVVLEAPALFSSLSTLGELAVTVGLVVGFLTRLTALSAIFLNLNFLMMNGATIGGAIDAAFLVGEVLVIVFAARLAGLDRRLAARGIRSPAMIGNPGY
jgi:uncharacterized membrane protein YphA (DoxX/SURF4 family)